MAINTTVYDGTVEQAIHMMPFIAPGHLTPVGMPIGNDLRTRKVVFFEPWILKELGVIHSTVFLLLGDKGYGKTTLMQSLFWRLMCLQAGVPGNDRTKMPLDMRARINDRRQEDGEPEYKALTSNLRSETLELNKTGLINIFDPTMYRMEDGALDEFALFQTIVNVARTIKGDRLLSHEPLAFQVGIHKMAKQGKAFIMPEVLEIVLRGLDLSDLESYYDASNDVVLENFRTGLATEKSTQAELEKDLGLNLNLNMEEQLQVMMQRPHNVSEAEFKRCAQNDADLIGLLLRGEYGRLFGGRNSLRNVLTRPMVNFDWTGLDEKACTMLESILWFQQTAAMCNNDKDVIPHLLGSDEEHMAAQNLMHVRAKSAYTKFARALFTASFDATQYQTDLTMAGNDGDEINKLNKGIVVGTGGRFVGRQPRDDEVLHDLSKLGFSDHDLDYTTKLGVGCFGFKVPDHDAIFFELILTPREREVFHGDAAVKYMTNRVPAMSYEDVRKRAYEMGTINLGIEEGEVSPAQISEALEKEAALISEEGRKAMVT